MTDRSDDAPLTFAAAHTDALGRLICPMCGNPVITERRTHPEEQLCTPAVCPAWRFIQVFDHDTREWLPIDADGFTPDDRRAEDLARPPDGV